MNIQFSRFAFDIISLWGDKLLSLTYSEYQVFLRKLFQTLTFNSNGRLRFISEEDIISPWSQEEVGYIQISLIYLDAE